jgi:hypothetical protein
MIHEGSRFAACAVLRDTKGRAYLGDRTPYCFHPHPDNRVHTVVQSDTLQSLAGMYFLPLTRPCGYWWAIGDFQAEPVVDPLVPLFQQRTQVVVPSVRVLTDIILAPRRCL